MRDLRGRIEKRREERAFLGGGELKVEKMVSWARELEEGEWKEAERKDKLHRDHCTWRSGTCTCVWAFAV